MNAVEYRTFENTQCRRQKICNMLFEWLKRDSRHKHAFTPPAPSTHFLIVLYLHFLSFCIRSLSLPLARSLRLAWSVTFAETKQENWKWIYENWKWHLNADHFVFIWKFICVSLSAVCVCAHHLLEGEVSYPQPCCRHNQTKSLSISVLLSHLIAAVA